METKVSIGISNRHIHLTKETYDLLFDEELTKKSDLNQIGQFAAEQRVTIETPEGILENVRIVGPFRKYNQLEISKSDARKLKIEPPVRRSGETQGAAAVKVKTPKKTIMLDCCIIANRHVHMNPEKALELGVVNKEIVSLQLAGAKSGLIDVEVTVTDNGYFEVHLDTDDANAFLLENGSEGTLII